MNFSNDKLIKFSFLLNFCTAFSAGVLFNWHVYSTCIHFNKQCNGLMSKCVSMFWKCTNGYDFCLNLSHFPNFSSNFPLFQSIMLNFSKRYFMFLIKTEIFRIKSKISHSIESTWMWNLNQLTDCIQLQTRQKCLFEN